MTRSGRLKTISSSEFRNLCRLCLINTNMKLHIFLDEGVQRQVHQKILNCLSLIVSEDDNLPKFVCYSCVNKLENFQDFRDLCHESENLLNSYLLSASKENHSVTKVEHPQDAWPSCAQQSSSQVVTSNEENAPSIRVDPTINVKVENDSEPSSECIVPDISHHVVIKKESNCESSRRGRTEGWVENPSSQICSSSQLNSIVSEASADLQKIGEVIITPVQVKQSIEMPNNVSDPCFNNVSDSRSCDMTDSAIFEDSDDDVQILDDDMEDGSAEVQDKVQAQIDSGEESKTFGSALSMLIDESFTATENCREVQAGNVQNASNKEETEVDVKSSFEGKYVDHLVTHLPAATKEEKFMVCEIEEGNLKRFVVQSEVPEISAKVSEESTMWCGQPDWNRMTSLLGEINEQRHVLREEHRDVQKNTSFIEDSRKELVHASRLDNQNFTSGTSYDRPSDGEGSKLLRLLTDSSDSECSDKQAQSSKNRHEKHRTARFAELGKSHQCHFCSKLFLKEAHFALHMKLHSGERPNLQKLCNKSSPEKRYVGQHQAPFTEGEKTYFCRLCERNFDSRSRFYNHLCSGVQFNEGEKTYFCRLCERNFDSRSRFYNHLCSSAPME